ncbi:MAG: beta-N-acetylhexosaminidase [Rikenellaceae bacterium]
MIKTLLSAAFFALIATTSLAQSAKDVVIPTPNSVNVTSGTISFGNQLTIKAKGAKETASFIESELEKQFNIRKGKSAVTLTIEVDTKSDLPSEGYKLEITNKAINILASSEAGAFYGGQTLIQLLRAGKSGDGNFTLTCQNIDDTPRFAWRSYMMDESRYFYGQEELLKLIDHLAAIKINTLHWHLTDDAGWRIEIKQYPLLTEIGSKRTDSETGTWGSGKTSGEPHEGFYTQEQVKEILAYARERHVKVIPEIEMPGHSSAAVASYPWLGVKNQKIDVPVKFGKHYHIYDVIDPRVKEFLQNVVVEVIELFETDVIHIGGDEVRFDYWEEDPDMVAYKEAKGYTSFMDIQIEFSNEMSRFIESHNCRMMGWNEILGENLHVGEIRFDETSTKIAPNVIVHFWKGDLNAMTAAAEQGYSLVNSYHEMTYLDYSYNSIPVKKAYNFDPIPEGLAPEFHDKILGFGTQMWREWAPTTERVQQMTFPRIAAYAEVGWSEKETKDYDNFLERLKPMVDYWHTCGIATHEY